MSPREQLRELLASPTAKKKAVKIALGLVLGGVAGFAYYTFVGCSTGHCPITSNPYISVAYGAAFGGIIGMT